MPKAPPNRINLTPLFCTKVKPQPDRKNFWDTKQRGLVLTVQPTGFRSFRFSYSFHGEPRWYPLGQIPLADARRIGAKLRVQIAEGKDPEAERRAEHGDTFRMVADRYLEEHAKRRHKSWKKSRQVVEKHLIPKWGRLSIRAITRSDVRNIVQRIESPSLYRRVWANASAIFTWCVRQDILATNPCHGIELPPHRSRERTLSDTEIAALIPVLDAMGTAEARVCMTILLTGQRPGEVIHMRAEHIKNGVWEMPGAPSSSWPGTKNGRSHRVPLAPLVLGIIGEMSHNATFLFGNPKMRLVVTMQKACEAAGIDPCRPHDLRRSFGTMVTRLGFGRQAMDRLLNHADHSISSVYDRHSYADEDRLIVERISQHISGLVDSGEQPRNVLIRV